MSSPPRPSPSTSSHSAAPAAQGHPQHASLLSNGAGGRVIGGTADDHAILGILAQMSQQQAQSKARSSAPPAEVPYHPTPTTSTSTTASTSTSNGPFPPFLTSRPSTSPRHLSPLPPLPPLPNIHPTAHLYHEGKLPEEGGGGGGLRPPFFGLGEAQGTAEGSRETSVDQDGGEEGAGESEVGTPGPAGAKGKGKGKVKAPPKPRGGGRKAKAGSSTPAVEEGEAGGTEQKEVDWSRTRKDNHKEVERRRRETINDGINELKSIVPNCDKNKGSILKQAVKYISELKEAEARNIERWTLEKLLSDQQIKSAKEEGEAWRRECERLKERVRELGGEEGGAGGVGGAGKREAEGEESGDVKRLRVEG